MSDDGSDSSERDDGHDYQRLKVAFERYRKESVDDHQRKRKPYHERVKRAKSLHLFAA